MESAKTEDIHTRYIQVIKESSNSLNFEKASFRTDYESTSPRNDIESIVGYMLWCPLYCCIDNNEALDQFVANTQGQEVLFDCLCATSDMV
jgi:hypothetical protein